VLFLEIKNRPGALAKAMEKLAGVGITVRYAQAAAYTQARNTAVFIAMSESDLPRALKLLD